jgi:hypothetical protein
VSTALLGYRTGSTTAASEAGATDLSSRAVLCPVSEDDIQVHSSTAALEEKGHCLWLPGKVNVALPLLLQRLQDPAFDKIIKALYGDVDQFDAEVC